MSGSARWPVPTQTVGTGAKEGLPREGDDRAVLERDEDALAGDGEALEGRRRRERVFGDLTVRDNMELAAYPIKADLDEAIERLFKISEKMQRLINSKAKGLSGGERQILLIGRALVGNPKLLLIDEPTEGLAAKVIDEIARILMEMKGRLYAVGVKASRAVAANDLRGLQSFRDYYGKKQHSWIIYQGTARRRIGDTEIWPWQEGIRELFSSCG